jgi:2-iminobutanoate/2-iminopropanoate deaminase
MVFQRFNLFPHMTVLENVVEAPIHVLGRARNEVTAGTTFEEQTLQAMNNLGAVLAAYGLDFSHVVKATVHLHHPGRDFAGFNTVYEKFVETPYPARTTVGSFLGDFLVEIDVVAVVP